MNRRSKALLMTALILPGLGQLYLGRKLTGIVLITLVNLLLLLALGVLLKGVAPVIAAQISSGSITPADILAGLESVADYGRALLIALALLWSFAIVDILRKNDVQPQGPIPVSNQR